MSMHGLENRLERMVEGFFARTFKSGVQPIEIAGRVLRTLRNQRSLDTHGNRVGPNQFTVWLSPVDFDELSDVTESLSNELAAEVLSCCRDEGIRLMGQPKFGWEIDLELRQGVFVVDAEVVEGATVRAFSQLIGPGGESLVLTGSPTAALQADGASCSVGRHASNDLVVDDSNVSRRHAVLELSSEGEVVVRDLDSLNGTRVNDHRVQHAVLQDGDRVTFGTVPLTFREQPAPAGP